MSVENKRKFSVLLHEMYSNRNEGGNVYKIEISLHKAYKKTKQKTEKTIHIFALI